MIRLQHVLAVAYLTLSSSACWVHTEPDHPHHHEEHRDHDEVIIHAGDGDGHHEEHHEEHHDHDHDHDHDHHD